MTFKDLQKIAKSYYPAIKIDRVMSPMIRNVLRTLFGAITLILCLTLGVASGILAKYHFVLPVYLMNHLRVIVSVLFTSGGFFLLLNMIEWYYRSHYFSDKDIQEGELAVTYEVSHILYKLEKDITADFLRSKFGFYAMLRCGFSKQQINTFIKSKRNVISSQVEFTTKDTLVSLSQYGELLCACDPAFTEFLFKSGVAQKDFIAVLAWIERSMTEIRKTARWWSRENIVRMPSLGNDWNYGKVWELEKYAQELGNTKMSQELAAKGQLYKKEIAELENFLLKEEQSNVLVISDGNDTGLEIVAALAQDIFNAKTHAALRDDRIYVLDPQVVIDNNPSKAAFEKKVLRLFNEAVRAGNIILVIENFSGLIESAYNLGSDVVSLLGKYFAFSGLKIIALTDRERFHSTLEMNVSIMSYFEKLTLKEGADESMLQIVERQAELVENRHGVFFTYPAVKAVVECSKKYGDGGNIVEKTFNIVENTVNIVAKKNIYLITPTDVFEYVQASSGIPVGEIQSDEKNKLLNLDTILSSRVIGQPEAINAITTAIKRARSGIINSNRPLGSFLFLGPTGVGKTETAKALAEAFFGGEENIIRFDMSEYAGDDAMLRLIGSFSQGKPGILSNKLREKPYGVLLLDEFEKTNHEVMNLFLQVLDEGFFSDMSGKRVNARNLIIIATSNAGSEIILEKVNNKQSLDKQEIIDALISQGVYKAELLNRFDDVILFEPLRGNVLNRVATLQLKKFAKRLEEKGIRLKIGDDLIQFVTSVGVNEAFGARAMNRVIQDEVESLVANSIITGKVRTGNDIILVKNTEADYSINPLKVKVVN